MKEIVVATKNPDKKKELSRLLKGLKIKVLSLERFPACPKVREGNASFRANAVRKAMTASKFTKRAALADDSGLEVEALAGRPGVRSSRFAGSGATYADNNRKLLNALRGKRGKERTAIFRCVAAVCAYPKVLAVVEGRIRGIIAQEAKGKSGFGYDPIFIVPKYRKTFAQLGPKIKNRVSHRAQALQKVRKVLGKYFLTAAPSKPPPGKSGGKS